MSKRNGSDDEEFRRIERLAESGDRQAAVKLFHLLKRMGREYIFKPGDKIKFLCPGDNNWFKGKIIRLREGVSGETAYRVSFIEKGRDDERIEREGLVGGSAFKDDKIELIG